MGLTDELNQLVVQNEADEQEKAKEQKKGFFSDIDFERPTKTPAPVQDNKAELVNNMFTSAVISEVKSNQALKQQVLDTAEHFVSTKMDTTKTETETENSIAKVKKEEDAISCYGMPIDKPISPWAIHWMKFGYNIMLGLWIFVASFTLMPVMFLFKKIHVGVKQTWLAIVLGLAIYLLVVVVIPLIVGLNRS